MPAATFCSRWLLFPCVLTTSILRIWKLLMLSSLPSCLSQREVLLWFFLWSITPHQSMSLFFASFSDDCFSPSCLSCLLKPQNPHRISYIGQPETKNHSWLLLPTARLPVMLCKDDHTHQSGHTRKHKHKHKNITWSTTETFHTNFLSNPQSSKNKKIRSASCLYFLSCFISACQTADALNDPWPLWPLTPRALSQLGCYSQNQSLLFHCFQVLSSKRD